MQGHSCTQSPKHNETRALYPQTQWRSGFAIPPPFINMLWTLTDCHPNAEQHICFPCTSRAYMMDSLCIRAFKHKRRRKIVRNICCAAAVVVLCLRCSGRHRHVCGFVKGPSLPVHSASAAVCKPARPETVIPDRMPLLECRNTEQLFTIAASGSSLQHLGCCCYVGAAPKCGVAAALLACAGAA